MDHSPGRVARSPGFAVRNASDPPDPNSNAPRTAILIVDPRLAVRSPSMIRRMENGQPSKNGTSPAGPGRERRRWAGLPARNYRLYLPALISSSHVPHPGRHRLARLSHHRPGMAAGRGRLCQPDPMLRLAPFRRLGGPLNPAADSTPSAGHAGIVHLAGVAHFLHRLAGVMVWASLA